MGPVMLYLILAVMKFKKNEIKKNSEQIEESAEECHFKNNTASSAYRLILGARTVASEPSANFIQ